MDPYVICTVIADHYLERVINQSLRVRLADLTIRLQASDTAAPHWIEPTWPVLDVLSLVQTSMATHTQCETLMQTLLFPFETSSQSWLVLTSRLTRHLVRLFLHCIVRTWLAVECAFSAGNDQCNTCSNEFHPNKAHKSPERAAYVRLYMWALTLSSLDFLIDIMSFNGWRQCVRFDIALTDWTNLIHIAGDLKVANPFISLRSSWAIIACIYLTFIACNWAQMPEHCSNKILLWRRAVVHTQ